MGAIPNKVTGFQDVETNMEARARFEAVYNAPIPPEKGWHLSLMFEAMERGELTACYVIGENPLRSEADTGRARKLLSELEHFVVQDMFLTDTAELASGGAAGHRYLVRGRGDGDLQRAPGAAGAQGAGAAGGSAGRHRDHLRDRPAARYRLGAPGREDVWNELRTLSPMHGGMSYQRLEELGGIQWPCPDEQHPGTLFLHARLWEEDPAKRGAPAPFTPVEQEPPVDGLSPEFADPAYHRAAAGLLQHRRAVREVHHAVAAAGDARPLARGRRPARPGRGRGGAGVVPRGSLEVPVHVDEILRAGRPS